MCHDFFDDFNGPFDAELEDWEDSCLYERDTEDIENEANRYLPPKSYYDFWDILE